VISFNLESIFQFLKANNYEPQIQQDTKQIYFVFKIQNTDFPVFVKIYESGDLMQLLAFIPTEIKTNTLIHVSRLLHLLNKEMDFPGFGMDEKAKVIFCRYVIPTKTKQISEELLDVYIKTLRTVCETLSPVIVTVAHGQSTFDEVMDKANDFQNKKNS
jgi:hypothetical protein